MDCLKELAMEEGVPSLQPQVQALHETFLNNVKGRGRVFEGTLLPMFLLRSGEYAGRLKEGTWQDDMKLGWQLFKRGRLALFPKTIKGKKEIRSILERTKDSESTK